MLAELSIEMREATTRYMNITCKDPVTGGAFDFSGYDVQTWVSFGVKQAYVANTIVENMVSYKIPAEMSKNEKHGIAETRIFRNGDVFEVLRVNIAIYKAGKPDTEYRGQ